MKYTKIVDMSFNQSFWLMYIPNDKYIISRRKDWGNLVH